MTRDTEKCPLSVFLEKICELFVGTNETVRIKRVSVERGSTLAVALTKSLNKNEISARVITSSFYAG